MSPAPPKSTKHRPQAAPAAEIVDPIWLLKSGAAVFALALLCTYITLCVFFARGQWQLVLTPSRTVAHTPAEFGLASTPIRFGPDETGQPQLDGWWFPADLPSDPTVLMLHDGAGSLADALPQAKALHDVRLNVLLFDYRGFGRSGGQHPTEALMEADSGSALAYLTDQRHIAPANILIYGKGVGASLAARLCDQHHELPALILESPDGDFMQRARQDPRARMVPVRLLFHETFPLADRLHTLATPKLLIAWTDSKTPPQIFQNAASPKMSVELAPNSGPQKLHEALRRFLDTYVAHPPPALTPAP